jgi:flagellar motor switch protein FliM
MRQDIEIGAMLGVGTVSLSELHSLACGDVLVLDRGPDDPVCLAINGSAQREARCTISQKGAGLELHLQASAM